MHKDMRRTRSTEIQSFESILASYHAPTPMLRFPMPGDESAYIVCVADNPRIHYCGDNSLFDPQTLSCLNYEVDLNILFKTQY